MYLAHWRMSRIASMLVSGNAALHANSERHLMASWNESITARKYLSKMLAVNIRHDSSHDTVTTVTTLGCRTYGQEVRGFIQSQVTHQVISTHINM